MNNPMSYVDETGEFWHIIIGAIVGGVANLVMNWKNIDGFWQGLAAFGVGAGAGAATAATGGAAGAGAWAVVGVGAGAGAVTAGTNNVIEQTGKNFSGMNNVDWKQVGISSAIGVASGAASAGAGYAASNMNVLVNGVSSPIARSAIVSPLAAGAGHIAGGTTANLFAGQNLGDAFANSFKDIDKSMAIGGAIGVSATIGVSYANGISPCTGNKLNTSNHAQQNNSEQQIELKSVGAKGASINKIDDNYLKQQGIDAEVIKYEYLGKSAQVSRFNLYKTPSGQIIISDGKNIQIPTDYFIKK